MNKPNSIKILLLWAPLADYTIACFKELSQRHNVDLYMIYQPAESNAPYNQHNLHFFRETFVYDKADEKRLERYCMNLNPDLIMMSSWNYPFYMSIAKKCKNNGSYVISSFDGQWRSTLKQRLGILVSPFFLKPAIHNFFVPGDRQASFARKLGYRNPLLGYYSARTTTFQNIKRDRVPHKFIFVGRLVPVKGIEQLIGAYKAYRASIANPWRLLIIGKGNLKDRCENVEGVDLQDFIQPEDLPQLLAEAGCFVLPSVFEPWGVVIHEAVISGLSVICTHACGASTMFVRDGQNGYIVNHDSSSLSDAMKKITNKTDDELAEMADVSRSLGSMWTTEKWADYVFDNICKPIKQLQEL